MEKKNWELSARGRGKNAPWLLTDERKEESLSSTRRRRTETGGAEKKKDLIF